MSDPLPVPEETQTVVGGSTPASPVPDLVASGCPDPPARATVSGRDTQPAPGTPLMPPIRPPGNHRPNLVILAVLVLVAAIIGAGVGYAVRGPGFGSSATTTSAVPGQTTAPASRGTLNAAAIASKVDPGVVDVDGTLGDQGEELAGTGMVIGSSGVVLTNNHVIDGTTSLRVTDVGNHSTYTAAVLGYDLTADIAVLQLHGASHLATVAIGSSSGVRTGDPVVAIGNAGGTGGAPNVASGEITALDQSITAVDGTSGASEQLTRLIETNAPIKAGDSGGPLIDASGSVIGMNTAGSSGFMFGGGSTAGYAIPIDSIRLIADRIEQGTASATVHVGPTAFLGVEVATFPPPSAPSGQEESVGAFVVGVNNGSPAQRAGMVSGDVIVSLGGHRVSTPTALSTGLQAERPGDTVQLGWQDSSGRSHSAQVTLSAGPPA